MRWSWPRGYKGIVIEAPLYWGQCRGLLYELDVQVEAVMKGTWWNLGTTHRDVELLREVGSREQCE